MCFLKKTLEGIHRRKWGINNDFHFDSVSNNTPVTDCIPAKKRRNLIA